MTVNCAVISRLPVEWRGLFKQLQSSVEQGNDWFTEETSSVYGSQPAWHKLLISLTKCEPSIEDEKLTFKPRLLLLPDKLQEDLLEFLLLQSCIIPDMDIKQFVLGVIDYTSVDSRIFQQLSVLFKETKFSDDVLTDFVQKSVKALDVGDMLHETLNTTKTDVVLPGTQHTVIILDESDDEEGQEPASKRQRLEEDMNRSIVYNKIEAIAMETDGIESDTIDEKIDKTEEEDTCSVLVGVKGMIFKIKEIWQNCIFDSEIGGLSEVSNLSVREIEEFCKMMEFDSMSDDSIELVCQHLCQVSESLSYSSSVCILTFVLGHRVIQLSQKASRKLSGAVTLISQKFPKQTVDSVLLPCTLQQEISVVQSEILCKIIKECLNATTKGYFIQKLMQNSFVFNENKIPVFQTIIDNHCDMTPDTLSGLLNCLSEVSLPMAKNLKFGKLLLALVNKHNKLLNNELKNKFENILDNHSTFLKKSIQTALNKIKVH